MDHLVYIGVNNYLIYEGLQAVLKQLDPRLNVDLINNSVDFYRLIRVNSKAYFMISNLWQIEIQDSRWRKIKDKIIFINEKPETIISDYINISNSKKEIQDIIKTVLPLQKLDKESLSLREKDILKCVVNGFSNKQIAEKLNISIHTVISHRKNITSKLEIKSVSGLTIYAVLNNLK